MDRRVRERRRLVSRERGRRRAGPIFLLVLVVVAAVTFLWLRSSSVFAVEQITASTTQHVTEQQIAEAVSAARGVSLLKVSTKAIEKNLSLLPYVRSVRVYRQFPHGLDVQVQEYEPVARVQTSDGNVWLVAADGRLLQKITTSTEPASVPLIVAGEQFVAEAGGTIPDTVLGAVPVAQLLQEADISSRLPPVDYISALTGGDVVIHLQGGAEVLLGEPTDLKQKMMVVAEIIQSYLRDGKTLEYVDASAADRVAVKAK